MLKRLGQSLGAALALPDLLRYAALRPAVGAERALSLTSERAARRPGLFGLYARQALYRRLLRSVGGDVHFGYQTLLSKPAATIGDRVYLGRFCTVGWAEVGDDVRIADGVQLLSGAHHHGDTRQGVDLSDTRHTPIHIGRGAWIGANAVVMADVGQGAIVGAGAVVTRPVAPGATVAGVPARPIAQPIPNTQAA
jgi:acetyltransferase-like isoleucine patch superfamily enzyme